MIDIVSDLFCKMLQKLIHLFAFMLHDFSSDVGCPVIGVLECMIIQATDFLCFLL